MATDGACDRARAVVLEAPCKTTKAGIAALEHGVWPKGEAELRGWEVRICMHAAALNFFDNLFLTNSYQMPTPSPFIGDEVRNVAVGDRVMLAMGVQGTLATLVVAPAAVCIPIPARMDMVSAAGLGVGFLTAYHGLVHRGGLAKDETLLVTGASGGMGAAAIQVGLAVGAHVIAAASSMEKAEAVLELGAHAAVSYGSDQASRRGLKDAVKDANDGQLADVVYDVVGGEVAHASLRCLCPEGRFLVVGFASGDIPAFKANLLLVKGVSAVGVRAGASMALHPDLAADMISTMSAWADAGKISPLVGGLYDFDDITAVRTGFTRLAAGQARGKLVIVMPSAEASTQSHVVLTLKDVDVRHAGEEPVLESLAMAEEQRLKKAAAARISGKYNPHLAAAGSVLAKYDTVDDDDDDGPGFSVASVQAQFQRAQADAARAEAALDAVSAGGALASSSSAAMQYSLESEKKSVASSFRSRKRGKKAKKEKKAKRRRRKHGLVTEADKLAAAGQGAGLAASLPEGFELAPRGAVAVIDDDEDEDDAAEAILASSMLEARMAALAAAAAAPGASVGGSDAVVRAVVADNKAKAGMEVSEPDPDAVIFDETAEFVQRVKASLEEEKAQQNEERTSVGEAETKPVVAATVAAPAVEPVAVAAAAAPLTAPAAMDVVDAAAEQDEAQGTQLAAGRQGGLAATLQRLRARGTLNQDMAKMGRANDEVVDVGTGSVGASLYKDAETGRAKTQKQLYREISVAFSGIQPSLRSREKQLNHELDVAFERAVGMAAVQANSSKLRFSLNDPSLRIGAAPILAPADKPAEEATAPVAAPLARERRETVSVNLAAPAAASSSRKRRRGLATTATSSIASSAAPPPGPDDGGDARAKKRARQR
ncbi:uncharacterized protein AMSG_03454 [Thecamonas trahens ATCC 50062]|uniref:Enoyl reductase (ER) domain-containing protein n=1 Tax=Thecamonas trahens ATCC 50062 TaxID=461836 RepID=A0A0L0D446_THETB|nr:hypothetical protein AMSG_03454 [Thecamonas trahens ATCC 50062]KNC47030.1 hypothetical protein AMSG_03454 [Thecamonas trahens ATCC 50062]|eukprot:XP_013759810.1 hypothetical protein AMSG_03454 [Thecamonas trahens ATCC 50062]